MSDQLLSVITLGDTIAAPKPINNTSFSDLSTGWTGSTITINSQTENAFNYSVSSADPGSYVISATLDTAVTSSWGDDFRVLITINLSVAANQNVRVRAYNGGSAIGTVSNTVAITSGVNNCTFDFNSSSSTFDRIRVIMDDAIDFTAILSDVSIQALDNDTTTFISGNRLFCYVDDTDQSRSVVLEQNPGATLTTLVAGPNIPTTAVSNVTNVDVNFKSLYTQCVSTSLYEWAGSYTSTMVYPYMQATVTPNAAQCSSSVVVCDVQFTPPFTYTSPTNAYTFDGVVYLTSSGSNGGRRYSQTDEFYSTMINGSGTVSGLAPGTYTFYARDANNCRATVEFTMPASFAYSPIYRMDFTSIEDRKSARLDIEERGYTGLVNEIYGGSASPMTLAKNQGEVNDKFDCIRNTKASITFLSKRNFQFIGLFSQDDKKHRVKYYKDYGSGLTIEWQGFVSPSLFSEDYITTPYPTTITATDNLTLLEDDDFLDDDENRLVGEMKLIKIIAFILKKTGLTLSIYQGINKFAGFHNINGDPLDQTYENCAAFYEEDGTPWKCDRVLKSILEPFGAFIIQQSGVWWLIDSERQYSSYNYRVFNSDGDLQSSSSFNPRQEITAPVYQIGQIFTGSPKLSILPAYGKLKLIHKLYTKSIYPTSLDDGWQVSLANSFAGYTAPYDIKGSENKGIEFFNLDAGVPNTNIPSAIPDYNWTTFISPEFTLTTRNDTLNIKFEYKVNLTDNFDPGADPADNFSWAPLWNEYRWQLKVNYNSTDYYFSEVIGWTDDTDFAYNYFYEEDFTNSFSSFDKDVPLPVFTSATELTVQLLLHFAGSIQKKYSGYLNLKAASTLILPIDSRMTWQNGLTAGVGAMEWSKLENSTDADSLYDTIRPNDYNGTTNPVVWRIADTKIGQVNINNVKLTSSVQLQNLVVSVLPDGDKPIDTETQDFTNDIDFKENLEKTIEGGDLPLTIVPHEIYTNIFRYSDGTPTNNWGNGASGDSLVQELFMDSMGNQYETPSWKLDGSLVSYIPFKFNNVIQHTIPATTVTITNEEFSNITGWTNFGSGATWAASSGNTKVKVTASGGGDTKYLVQSSLINIPSGIRISVASSVQRTLTGSSRADTFVIVLFRDGNVVQTVDYSDFTSDTTVTTSVAFNTSGDADNIGFYVKNLTGSANNAAYEVDYFRVSGQVTTRYYYPDSLSRDEKQGVSSASLVEIFSP